MRRLLVRAGVLIGLGLLFVGGDAMANGWPGFRGPNSDGTVPGVELFDGASAELSLGWKRALGSGYSAIAVADGRLVTMFADGDADVLAAFDVESGDELWRYRIADAYKGHDGSHDGPISTPLMTGGRVYGLGPMGHLFAVNAANGEQVWATHLVDDHEATKPYYGFTTSPLMADGVLVVEVGAAEGKAVAGFSPQTGEMLWNVGDDKIEYHSPIATTIGGRRLVVAAGKANVYGLEAKTGAVLWSYEHGGDERAMGGFTIVPLPAGEDRLFLMNKIDSSVMLSVTSTGDEYEINELWNSNAIKSSYVPPVYHNGSIYGMSNRIFVCMDANTGEIQWRSREPGDGFPTLVGGKLVILTKPGSLHVVEASSAGYNELARLDLFDEHAWSEVAYADGHLYARSMAHLARIDPGSAAPAVSVNESWTSDTEFGRVLANVSRADDKTAVLEAYLAEQASFPIVETSGAVHFVYRGESEDVGIVGDMIGFRREDPMTRIDGTDLYYYSTRLEPDAAVTYGFITDFGEPVADPLNPNDGEGLFGEVSWLAMPAWDAPDFLDQADPERQGRLELLEWESQVLEDQTRTAQVYLPAGYDGEADRRYPVFYVHDGKAALEQGEMKNALDQLIGVSVEPLIAVFVLADEEDPRADLRQLEPYSEMIVKELVPEIDRKYRTIADPLARATVGSGRAGNVALFSAFEYPEHFGRVAAQSATMAVEDIPGLSADVDSSPKVIYLDWGSYHMRSPHEAWDYVVENRRLWNTLREAGYRPAGGEVPEGFGWPCWTGHTDEVVSAMFPLTRREELAVSGSLDRRSSLSP
jgi:enterochelin esterase-like enzyme/outer membrane protein assembly factor BamB